MLILLPPSEGKTEPRGKSAPLDDLSFANELGPLRARLLKAMRMNLEELPAGKAIGVYSGVLYEHLDWDSLPAAAKRRGNSSVLIASALWGMLRPTDRIPIYKLPIGEAVPRLGKAGPRWREPLAKALSPLDTPRQLVVDCRSGGYASLWRPQHSQHVQVRAFRQEPDGSRKPISHMAKASRGRLTRAALEAKQAPRDVEALGAAAESAGMAIEIGSAGKGEGRRWLLDVIER